ncbi:MAG: MFS transporter [Acutalibacter sp.]
MENSVHKKLPMNVKWLFASGDFAKTLLVVMTAAFSLYFYTDIIGMDPKVVAMIILIAKIWDFINDPMMGALVDRTKSKEGKCRMWLKYMSVPGGVVLALNFIMPELSVTGKIVWVAITYTLQGMASTALMIPQNTLMSRITTDPAERASINGYRGYFGLAANLIVSSFGVPFVQLAGNGDMRRGFAIFGIVCGVVYAINYLIVYFCTKGYEPMESAPAVTHNAAPEVKEKIKTSEVLTNWPWLVVLLSYFCTMIAASVSGSTGLYYAQYNLGDINIYSVMNFIGIVGAVLVYPLMGSLVKKFGNAKLVFFGSLIAAVAYLFRFVTADANIWIIYIGYFIGSFGQTLASCVVMLVVYDSYIYMEHKTGKPAPEALLVSGYSVSYKVGMALATPLAGWLLGMVPFVSGAAVQEKSVLNLFFYENTLLPAVSFVISGLLGLLLIKFDKQIQAYKAIDAAAAQGHTIEDTNN